MLNRKFGKSLPLRQQQEIQQRHHWLLRFWLIHYRASTPPHRQPATANSGFVLPTMIFVLLATVMVMGAMVFRSFNRTAQVSGARQQAAIANAATPAIERAKAKLEYMFTKDARLPSGRIRDDQIAGILLNNGQGGTPNPSDLINLYKLPDEEWVTESQINLDFNQDNTIGSNANNPAHRVPMWRFTDPTTNTTMVYGLFFNVARRNGNTVVASVYDNEVTTPAKPNNLIVRNGPIASAPSCGAATGGGGTAILPSDGWFNIGSTGNSKRAFQVMAIAVPSALADGNPSTNPANPAIATLQYQQDREIKPGNTYGAWFRYDLEIFPGPNFNWNGRTYSAGTTLITANNTFTSYLISSPRSCYYMPVENSEIASGGLFGIGSMRDDNWTLGGTVRVHMHPGTPIAPVDANNNGFVNVTNSSDSIDQSGISPLALAADPVQIVTQDKTLPRNSAITYSGKIANTWSASLLVEKQRVIVSKTICPPYVDDTFRADNRYGPKPSYAPAVQGAAGCEAPTFTEEQGSTITDADLIRNDPPPDPNGNAGDPANVGLDGYWERRAMNEGLRIIVGERLELGNMNGWQSATSEADPNADPLNPPPPNAAAGSSMATRAHEQRQWRALRDNLAAAQSMAVYHTASSTRQFPVACIAATAHPGTSRDIVSTDINNDLAGTIERSTRFDLAPKMTATSTVNGVTTPNVYTSFLTGKGTNGWEFNPPGPDGTEAGFRTAIDNPSSNLNKALTNLAYFAGDRYGAYPPRQDATGDAAVPSVGPVAHPYPNLAMFGNFSNLRRIMNRLNGLQGETNIDYNDLSPADKATLHTASCTIQMLAHNLRLENDIFTAVLSNSGLNWTTFGVKLRQLVDMNTISNGSPIIGRPKPGDTGYQAPGRCRSTGTITRPNGTTIAANAPASAWNNAAGWTGCPPVNPNSIAQNDTHLAFHPMNYFSQFTTEEWLTALGLTAEEKAVVTQLVAGPQLERDRKLGFRQGFASEDLSGNYDPTTGIWTNPPTGNNDSVSAGQIDPNDKFKISCDPRKFAQGDLASGNSGARLGLALVICGINNPIKYPSLYYLFPMFNHGHGGANDIASGGINHLQPTTEPYIDQAKGYTRHTDINGSYTYQAVNPETIALAPRAVANWVTPQTTTLTNRRNTLVVNYPNTTVATAPNLAVSFLDKGMFNAREMMPVRVLDVDLDLLRRTTTSGTGFNAGQAQSWLSNSGIVYAFREDAVREDAIARPRATTFANCQTVFPENNTSLYGRPQCLMNAVSAAPQDPPVYLSDGSHNQGISIKSVDAYADPDRRPHGFRLRNGSDLRRIPDPPADFQMRGMSFISDSPVYIMTDGNEFNGHRSGTTLIEEFTQLLPNPWTFSGFYGRTTLNSPPFAGVNDQWRPTEILADGITILSSAFNDGWFALGIRSTNPLGANSFRGGLNRPNTSDLPWVREDGLYTNQDRYASPIKISRRGFPLYCKTTAGTLLTTGYGFAACTASGGIPQEYGREMLDLPAPTDTVSGAPANRSFLTFQDARPQLITPTDNQRVNAMLISGITPSRRGNAYGGLHNFPRFLENWGNRNLFISGTLMQLNFSNYATGPFDQDSWEPGATPTPGGGSGNEWITYYGAPNRLWGYDVALQYAPATPVALRMAAPTLNRDEFYRELSATDPYVCTLRQAINFPCN